MRARRPLGPGSTASLPNLCLDHLRKTAWFRPVPLEDLASTTPDECDVAEMVVVAAEQEERKAVLSRALAALPSEDRLLLALRVGEQLSYDEIAGLLELNPSTVGTRLYRVRARLHRMAQQYLNEGVEESDGVR